MSIHHAATFVETLPSAIGPVAFQFTSVGELVSISMITDPTPKSPASMSRPQKAPSNQAVRAWLEKFLDGKSSSWPGAWRMPGTSPFYRKVYECVAKIPTGQTMGYGDVAAVCGSPGAARAVGTAMRLNPMPLLVPCHRVLAANFKLGGFAGGVSGALDLKRQLLSIEGIACPAK